MIGSCHPPALKVNCEVILENGKENIFMPQVNKQKTLDEAYQSSFYFAFTFQSGSYIQLSHIFAFQMHFERTRLLHWKIEVQMCGTMLEIEIY